MRYANNQLKFRKDMVLEHEEARQLMRINKKLADIRMALDESSIVAVTDHKGIISFVNDHFCAISKYSRMELIGQDHRILNSGYHPKTFFQKMWKTIARARYGERKSKIRLRMGAYIGSCGRNKLGSTHWRMGH